MKITLWQTESILCLDLYQTSITRLTWIKLRLFFYRSFWWDVYVISAWNIKYSLMVLLLSDHQLYPDGAEGGVSVHRLGQTHASPECFMIFIHPLRWQHPFVPVLSHQMLDFIMAPTAYLMGCHTHHFKQVAEVRTSFVSCLVWLHAP